MTTSETRVFMQKRAAKHGKDIKKLLFLICKDCEGTVKNLVELNTRFVAAKYRLKELALIERIDREEEFKKK